jgi:hypothetical protein
VFFYFIICVFIGLYTHIMAAKAKGSIVTFRPKSKTSRPGVYAKTRSSSHKSSKNYLKKYRGQGK